MDSIRQRRHADIPRCVEVLREVHRAHAYPVNWPADPGGWLSPPRMSHAWVAVAGHTVIGHAALTRDADACFWVERLFVSPDAGRTGAGTALLQRCVATAGHEHAPIALEVADNGEAAVRMYERAGWRRVSKTPIDWGGAASTAVLRYAPGRPG